MPPRISIVPRLGISNLYLRPAPTTSNGSLSIASRANIVTLAQRRKHKDPYVLAQAKQRKAVNVARQQVLQEERKEALGDPVRGITTPYIESFDNVGGAAVTLDVASDSSPEQIKIKTPDNAILNHFLKPEELEDAIKHSYALTEPVPAEIRDVADPAQEEEDRRKHADGHARAMAAIAKIVSLENASSKEKTRANIQRCVDTFGRHNTDLTLRPRPQTNPAIQEGKPPLPEKTPRAGPDTGSSEVQIAILTAKIRVLANALEQKGCQKDKMNKRNLRLLVHRRQKLLNYLRRKERGGDRWQHLVETLGLTEATWKGEISL